MSCSSKSQKPPGQNLHLHPATIDIYNIHHEYETTFFFFLIKKFHYAQKTKMTKMIEKVSLLN